MRVSLARSIISQLDAAPIAIREQFLCSIAQSLLRDSASVQRAIDAYRTAPSRSSLSALHYAAEPSSLELLRRLNLAPGATLSLVRLRETLLDMIGSERYVAERQDLISLDSDFVHLFSSWFNRGFLLLKRIDWSTPASILDLIIRYEAVHTIRDWTDLRSRLDPEDRRCFAYFHPALVDEPLIFVEVALTIATPRSISTILDQRRAAPNVANATTAVFYSISNCQRGLAKVSFGDFLIKQVVEQLRQDLPAIKTFVTLSPVPGFADWLKRKMSEAEEGWSVQDRSEITALLSLPGPWNATLPTSRSDALARAAAHYLLRERTKSGKPLDPVASFHLGNGAELRHINPCADMSEKGVRQSLGVMVNYLYDLDKLDANQKAFEIGNAWAASDDVRRLLHSAPGIDSAKPRSREPGMLGSFARAFA